MVNIPKPPSDMMVPDEDGTQHPIPPPFPQLDAATADLLAPPPAMPAPHHLRAETPSASTALSFEQALANGTIPQFEPLSSELPQPNTAPAPINPDQERAAFEQLLAFIRENADPGTTVTAMDPSTFTHGLTSKETSS